MVLFGPRPRAHSAEIVTIEGWQKTGCCTLSSRRSFEMAPSSAAIARQGL